VPERFGNYIVHERLGAGGMATVHRATMSGIAGFERPIALKRLLPHLAHDESFVRAFVREARIAAHLRHVNVAQTYDLGLVDETYYIAMELIEGRDLRQVLRQAATAAGPMPPAIVINLLSQVCEALDYAHGLADDTGQPLGIIHRDVSPANIIVTHEGTAKLIDFGIARATASGLMTMSGQLKGKFAYIAPETITGVFDARADLFSLGVVAHELLTATPLFAAQDEIATLYRVREGDIAKPSAVVPGIPDEVDSIVMTALERDPAMRWQSAAAMRGALGVVASRPQLRANAQDVGRWIECAFGVRPSARRAAAAPPVSPRGGADSPAIGPNRGDTGRRRAAHDTDVGPERTPEPEQHTEDSVVVQRVVELEGATDEQVAVVHAPRAIGAPVPAIAPVPREDDTDNESDGDTIGAAALGAAPASSSTLEMLVRPAPVTAPPRRTPRGAEAQTQPRVSTDGRRATGSTPPRTAPARPSTEDRATLPVTGNGSDGSRAKVPSRPPASKEAATMPMRPVGAADLASAPGPVPPEHDFEARSTGRLRALEDPRPSDSVPTGKHRPYDAGPERTLVDVAEANIVAEQAAPVPAAEQKTLLLDGAPPGQTRRGRDSTGPRTAAAPATRGNPIATSHGFHTNPGTTPPPLNPLAPEQRPLAAVGSQPPMARPPDPDPDRDAPTLMLVSPSRPMPVATPGGPQAPIALGADYATASATYAATIMTPVPGTQPPFPGTPPRASGESAAARTTGPEDRVDDAGESFDDSPVMPGVPVPPAEGEAEAESEGASTLDDPRPKRPRAPADPRGRLMIGIAVGACAVVAAGVVAAIYLL
jgi:hypothetical protein